MSMTSAHCLHTACLALSLPLWVAACGDPVDAAGDEVATQPRPYAYVDGDEGLAPLGPLRDDANLFVVPLASLSERVPRVGASGDVRVTLVAGDANLVIGDVRARVVRHAADERVLLTQDGPALFGPAELPRRTTPPRALAALARQDGAQTGRATFALECEPAGRMLVLGAGEWGAGDGARTGPITIDGVAFALGLGPNDVVAVPARATHTVDASAVALDHASLRTARPVGLSETPELPLLERHIALTSGFSLARRAGLGHLHPVPAFAIDGARPDQLRDGATALARGEALALTFERAPLASNDGSVATLLLEVDVRQGGLPDSVTTTLADLFEPSQPGWFHALEYAVEGDGEPSLLVHFEGPDGQLDIRPTMGPGAAVGDFDGDGLPDLFLVQGSGRAGSEPNGDRLLKNTSRDGRIAFADVTERAGVGGTGAGMGALFVDLDGDGDLDLYVANYGRDALFLNRGDGTFADARDLLPGHDLWSAGVAAADTDADGDLDLYITSYLDFDPAKTPPAEELGRYQREDPVEMLPFSFPGQRNVFLQNDGVGPDGRPRFTDVTEALGLLDVQGRGMQPIFWDFDRDGDADLYIANDVSFNVLFRNEGDGTFKDVSFATGLDDPRGGMGLAAGDVDADGDEDLFLTNWQLETNALYQNNLIASFGSSARRAAFHDTTLRAGLGRSGIGVTSWGVALFDIELDGDLDAFVANGYTSPDYVGTGVCVGQPNHLFQNDGRAHFEDGASLARAALAPLLASRGAVPCDFDRDGDLDLVVTNNNGPTQLLENRAPRRGAWVGIALRQGDGNRFAIGAEVTVRATGPSGQRSVRRALRAGEGYLTGNPAELHFGLGDATEIDDVTVRWPGADARETRHTGLALGRWQTISR